MEFGTYDAGKGIVPEKGDVIILASDLANNAYNPFNTSVITEFVSELDIKLERPYYVSTGPGVEKYSVTLESLKKNFRYFKSGPTTNKKFNIYG